MREVACGFAVLAACLAGCLPVPSLYPLVAGDGLEVPAIVGTWHGSGDTLVFEQAGVGEYTVWSPNPDASGVRWRLGFVRLDGRLFADLCVVERSLPGGDMTPFVRAMHVIARVDLSGDSLRLEPLDDDWVDEAIRKGRLRLRVERPGGSLVLTEPTPGLRRMLVRIASEADAFSPEMSLVRAR